MTRAGLAEVFPAIDNPFAVRLEFPALPHDRSPALEERARVLASNRCVAALPGPIPIPAAHQGHSLRVEGMVRLMGSVATSAAGCLMILGPSSVRGEEAQIVGMVTEVNTNRGVVEVMVRGASDWKRAQPLRALRSGDAIRATGHSSAHVVISGESRIIRIDSRNSPFVVTARSDRSKPKAMDLLLKIFAYLGAYSEDRLATLLGSRGEQQGAGIISPRNGPVLPESLIFEWSSVYSGPSTVTISGAAGMIVQRQGVIGDTFEYSDGAVRVVPGERYRIRVKQDESVFEAWFEVLPADRTGAVRRDLAELDAALPGDTPLTSRAIVRAGYLSEEGLFHDARLTLLTALARDRRSAAIYVLLGGIYGRTGLPDLAAQAYWTSERLLTGDLVSPRRP